MTAQAQLVTAEELLQLPDDGFRYELVRGELRKMTPAGFDHGTIAVRLTWRLAQFVEEHQLGQVCAAETGFRLSSDPDTVRAPDVAFVRQDRIAAVGPVQGFWLGAPDLAAEVVSPNDLASEVEEKVAEWLAAGARLVLVIYPRQRTVKVYRSITDLRVLTEADTLDGGEVVPGWTLAVRQLFA